MCLILFAWHMHKDYPLIVAANRDEFHARPTEGLAFWQDRPDVLAGRDSEAGGTWMGITRSGRFAALTNYRELADRDRAGRSRGLIVSECLMGEASAEASVMRATAEGEAYRGFNLLAADREALWWTSNRGAGPLRLAPGLYGLSNHLLETPWPKVVQGKARLGDALGTSLSPQVLLELLADTRVADDPALPDTGVDRARERMLSAARIVSPAYGTRASTAILMRADGRCSVTERSYDAAGEALDTLGYEFTLDTRPAPLVAPIPAPAAR